MDTRLQMHNEQFRQLLQTRDGLEKIAQTANRKLIKDHIEESGVLRKILPPQPAPQPLQVTTNGQDTLYAVIEVAPNALAMTVDFEGANASEVIRAGKAPVAFFSIESKRYTINETKLMAYSNPIVQIIEEKIPTAIEAVEDRTFVRHIEAACQVVQLEANAGVAVPLNSISIAAGAVEDSIHKGELARVAAITGSSIPLPIQRSDLVTGRRSFTNNKQLRGEVMLGTEYDLEGMLQWTIDEMGNELTGSSLSEGMKLPNLFGLKTVMTLKTRIFRPGNLYFFAPEDALGVFYTLTDTKMYMDKRGRTIEFWAWEDIGMIIANVRGVAKVELYPCDANPSTDADGLLTSVTTMAEANLAFTNNRVDSGIYYPQISQF